MKNLTSEQFRQNETLSIIDERHSTRFFSNKEVSEKDIMLLLNAANKAPSAHNLQSWKFIVIRDQKKKDLATLIANRATDFPRTSAVLLRMAARSISSAPVVIAVANTGELVDHGRELFQISAEESTLFFRTMEIQSSSAAVQNLLLAATSLELGTVWLGVMYLIKDEILALLEEPKGEFMAIVPIGYPEKPGSSPKKRSLELILKQYN